MPFLTGLLSWSSFYLPAQDLAAPRDFGDKPQTLSSCPLQWEGRKCTSCSWCLLIGPVEG